MATSLTSSGISLLNGSQTSIEGIVKIGFTSSPTTNHYTGAGGGSWTYLDVQVDMGVPSKANNWYRVRWQSCIDDNGASGHGAAVYRYTPSSGWNRMADQGHHAQLENNASDFYWTYNCEYLIPVHPSYPNEAHSFRMYGRGWNSDPRINCSIGGDLRRNGWQNNIMEVFELDTSVVSTTNLTRY